MRPPITQKMCPKRSQNPPRRPNDRSSSTAAWKFIQIIHSAHLPEETKQQNNKPSKQATNQPTNNEQLSSDSVTVRDICQRSNSYSDWTRSQELVWNWDTFRSWKWSTNRHCLHYVWQSTPCHPKRHCEPFRNWYQQHSQCPNHGFRWRHYTRRIRRFLFDLGWHQNIRDMVLLDRFLLKQDKRAKIKFAFLTDFWMILFWTELTIPSIHFLKTLNTENIIGTW